jgi:Zn finger protein HypA/HybF involved in hydrogenase expression
LSKKDPQQLQFDFAQNEKSVNFKKVRAVCKCGCQIEVNKASIVIEMTVICPECKSVIQL